MSLLDRFRRDTTFDSEGRFTLDEGKARKKMSRFQLSQTEEFMLLVVQAAVVAGARRLRVEVQGASPKLEAEGVTLEPSKLERLEEFLFDTSRAALPYRLLGVARNSVAPGCTEAPTIKLKNGRLEFSLRRKAAFKNLTRLLEERLRYLSRPLVLNGREFRALGLPATGGISLYGPDAGESELTLVRHGVVVGLKRMRCPVNFSAVAEDAELQLDASFSNVVEDRAYKKLLSQLKARAVKNLAARVKSESAENPELYLRWLVAKPPDPAGKALSAAPLFPLADRPERCSFADLEKQRKELGKVMTSGRKLQLRMDFLVVHQQAQLKSLLPRIFPPRSLVDAESDYLTRLEAEENRKRWQRSPRPTTLPPGRYLAQRKTRGKGWKAEIGFLGPPGGPSSVDILYQGKLLCSEPLAEVPPGAAAVVNFNEVEVSSDWSRPTGRTYRGALKALREQLEQLMAKGVEPAPEDIYPGLEEWLLSRLEGKKTPPECALRAPLFEELSGRRVALQELSRRSEVLVGVSTDYPASLPEALRPGNVLAYQPRTYKILRHRLGKRVVDFRSEQRRRVELGQRLAIKVEPRLRGQSYLSREPVRHPQLEGELGLLEGAGPGGVLTLMSGGVPFEELPLKKTRAFAAEAVIDSESFRVNDDWSGLRACPLRSRAIDLAKQRLARMERDLLELPEHAPAVLRRLLLAYPEHPLDDFADRPLLELAGGGTCSLEQARQEHTAQGALPVGAEPVPGRLVLLGKLGPERNLLESYISDFQTVSGEELLRELRQRREFEARKVHGDIQVSGGGFLSLPLRQGRGEVKVGRQEGGAVECFVKGRFVCRLTGLLPKHCRAAVEHPDLRLDAGFESVEFPTQLKEQLRVRCAEAMLALLQEGHGQEAREIALAYFAENPVEEVQERFEELPLFAAWEGPPRSVAWLRQRTRDQKSLRYVGPHAHYSITPPWPVLRLEATEVHCLRKNLKMRLREVDSELQQLAERQRLLDRLPQEMPAHRRRMSRKDKKIVADLGIPRELPGQLVGRDSQGQPLGLLPWDGLPLCGFIDGARPVSKELARAKISSDQQKKLRRWAAELYLNWVEQLDHRAIAAEERELALRLLNLLKRQLGSEKHDHEARIASVLWQLPLFDRVDGTHLSGAALMAEFEETGEPLVLAESSWRAPNSAVLAPADSTPYFILSGILGKNGVMIFDRPPLLDRKAVTECLGQVVGWGLSPLSALGKWVGSSDRTAAKSKKGGGKTVRRDPEKVFLKLMNQEVINLLGMGRRARSEGLFKKADLGSWPLGPPLYRVRDTGQYRFNRLNRSIRWMLQEIDHDGRHHRLMRVLLLIHWVSLVNEASEKFRDEDEIAFLGEMSERLLQSFSK